MNDRYERCIKQWDAIFGREATGAPKEPGSGNEAFDNALDWLCEATDSVLDFGCGNGTVLFLCALRGTKRHIGIDLSEKAIDNARKRSEKVTTGTFSFVLGGVEEIKGMESGSADAIVLSNIVDNLYPDDAMLLLSECERVLKPKGKVLVKLNPHLSSRQIADWNIRVIDGDLLDDGLLLWNNTTDAWREIFRRYFRVLQFEEIYYPEHDQTNRMFLLEK